MAISIEIGGDYSEFAKELKKATHLAKSEGAAISAAMNNSMSMHDAGKTLAGLTNNLAKAAKAAQGVKAGTDAAASSIQDVAKAAGIAGDQFTKMAQQALKIQVSRDLDQRMRSIQKATGASTMEMAKLRASVGDVSGGLKTMSQAAQESLGKFINMKNAVLGVAAALGARQMGNLTSEWIDLESRVGIAAGSMEKAGAIMERLKDIADRAYAPLQNTADAFLTNATVLNDLGFSMEKQLDLADAMTNALVVSGAKGQQATMVIEAMGRAMSTGKLSGKEFNTVLNYGSRVTQALADSLGVSITELRKLAKEGKLTTDVIANAMTKNVKQLQTEAERMPATIQDAMVRLKNSMLAASHQFDIDTGFTEKTVKAIDALRDRAGDVAKAMAILAKITEAVAAGVVVSLGGRGVVSMIGFARATMTASGAVGTLGKSMAALKAAGNGVMGLFGGPLGLALTAAGAGIYVLAKNARESRAAFKDLTSAAKEAHPEIARTADEMERLYKIAAEKSLKEAEEELERLKKAAKQFDFSKEKRGRFQRGSPYKAASDDAKAAGAAVTAFNKGLIDSQEALKRIDAARAKFGDTEKIKEAENAILNLSGAMKKVEDKKDALGDAISSAKDLSAPLSEFEESLRRAKEIGLEISGTSFLDFSSALKGLESTSKQITETFDGLLDDLKSKQEQMRNEMAAGTLDASAFAEMEKQHKELNGRITELNQMSVEARLASEAKFYADLLIKQAELVKGEQLTAQEREEAFLGPVSAYLKGEAERELATKRANKEALEDIVRMANEAITVFASMAFAGTAAGQAILAGMKAAKAGAEANLEGLKADIKTAEENAQATHDKIMKGLSGGGGGGGGGRKGGGGGGGARDTAKALQDMELTLAKMKGDLSKVAEIEGLRELEQFTKLVQDAGLKGEEAAAKIEEFKAAQAIKVNTDHLQEQLNFYKDLRAIMPAAGEEYDKIREQLRDLEEEQYRAIGISEEFLAVWREHADLREATDAVSGLRVAMIDYVSGLTEAQMAQDLFQTATSEFSSALFDVVTGAKDAKEAFGDMAKSIVDQLIKIMIQMYVMKPLVEWMQNALGGGATGGGGTGGLLGSIIGGLFGSAKGNVFPAGAGISAYSSQVVSKPTIFPFAKGVGLMGEAGAEAVMPLKRNSRGQLGVMTADNYQQAAPQAPQVTVNITNNAGDTARASVGDLTPSGDGFSLDIIVDQIEQKIVGNHNRGASPLTNTLKKNWGMGNRQAKNAYYK